MANKDQHNSNNRSKSKKVGKIIGNILFYIVMAFVIVVLVFSFIQKVKGEDNYPFFGYRGMLVETGSMSFKCAENAEFLKGHDEQMKERDLVFTRKLKEGEKPEVYDIVTFKLGNATVIHRVVEIYTDPISGQVMYVTQGDARPERDAPKTLDQITGIYVGSLGQFGVVVDFLQSSFGIVAIIACIAIALIAKVLMNYAKEKENLKEQNGESEEKEQSEENEELPIKEEEISNEESLELGDNTHCKDLPLEKENSSDNPSINDCENPIDNSEQEENAVESVEGSEEAEQVKGSADNEDLKE